MTESNEAWLVNRITGSIGDDYYLDRAEEQGIKQEASSRGIPFNEIERILRRELEKQGAAHERLLVEEMERLLHQYTDQDKYLDRKEEADLYLKVTHPASGRKKGLDPRVARDFVDNFCIANGVKRVGDVQRKRLLVAAAAAVVALLTVGYALVMRGPQVIEKPTVVERVVGERAVPLSAEERTEIDDLIGRAENHIERAEYTDPPERSAKQAIDRIRSLDPAKQYKAKEVAALIDRIVDEYLKLADKSFESRDELATHRWIERAKLFNRSSEVIGERERRFGFLKDESLSAAN